MDFDILIHLNKQKKKRFFLNGRFAVDFDILIDLDGEKKISLSMKDQPLSSMLQLT